MAGPKGDKTEQATGKKLQDARDDGNVPRTPELSQVFVMGAFLIFCHLFGPGWLDLLRSLMASRLSDLAMGELTPGLWMSQLRGLMAVSAQLIFLPIGMMAVASVSGHLVQGAPLFTLKPLKPKFSKVNPLKGIKKVFKLRSLVNLAKALLKTSLFTLVAILAVKDAFRDGLPGAPGAEGTFLALFTILGKVIMRIVLLWLLLALIDLLYSRYQYFRDLMMSKQEVKDERKQQDGDPQVKARIKSKQYEAARARMMADVPSASVVITNPTHYAVAIRYVPGETEVPKLLAKGRGLIAKKIREIAAEHRVPIISDPPLARALYRSVPVGSYIPEALYRAVAEILAVVMRGRRSTGFAGGEARA